MTTEPTKSLTKSLTTFGLRTILQLFPGGSGAAQAWSDYENHQHAVRIDEMAARLDALESMKEQYDTMPDATQLLETVVVAVKREVDAQKRSLFPVAFLNLIRHSSKIPPDERSYLLDTLEYLTLADLKVLRLFQEVGWSTGAILAQSGYSVVEAEMEKLLTPFVSSTAKLEARGLIISIPNPGRTATVGDPSDWHNQYQTRAWRLMPAGRSLLNICPIPPEPADAA